MAEQADCLFCSIVRGEIPASIVYKEGGVTAFRDIAPQAPTHILIIPDQHIGGIAHVGEAQEHIAGRLLMVAAELARRDGIAETGYRLIVNQGHDGGQSVPHLHVHLLGGRLLPTPLA
jgi:histidine triad (HIT) family protein